MLRSEKTLNTRGSTLRRPLVVICTKNHCQYCEGSDRRLGKEPRIHRLPVDRFTQLHALCLPVSFNALLFFLCVMSCRVVSAGRRAVLDYVRARRRRQARASGDGETVAAIDLLLICVVLFLSLLASVDFCFVSSLLVPWRLLEMFQALVVVHLTGCCCCCCCPCCDCCFC